MFLLAQRIDCFPDMRTLINMDHVAGVTPIDGGIKTRIYLANGDTWDIDETFTHTVSLIRGTAGVVG